MQRYRLCQLSARRRGGSQLDIQLLKLTGCPHFETNCWQTAPTRTDRAPNLLVRDERRCVGAEVVCVPRKPESLFEWVARQTRVEKEESADVCVLTNLYTCVHKYLIYVCCVCTLASHSLDVCVCVCVRASSSRQPAESCSENLLPPRHDRFSLNATDRWAY